MTEIMQRHNDSMKDRLLQVESLIHEHAFRVREIDLCRDVIMYAEQSERMESEATLGKIYSLIENIENDIESKWHEN